MSTLTLAWLLLAAPAAKDCRDAPAVPHPASAVVESCRALRPAERLLPAPDGGFAPARGRVGFLRLTHPRQSPPGAVLNAWREALRRAGWTLEVDRELDHVPTLVARRAGPPEARVGITVESLNLGERIVSEVTAVELGPLPAVLVPKGRTGDRRDAKGCADLPDLPRPNLSWADACDLKGSDELDVPGEQKARSLSGEVRSVRYRHDPAASPLEVTAAWRSTLQAAGFQLDFDGLDGAERALVGKRQRDGREEWVYVASGWVNAGEWTYSQLTRVVRDAK